MGVATKTEHTDRETVPRCFNSAPENSIMSTFTSMTFDTCTVCDLD